MRLIDADKLEVKHFVQRTEKIIGYDGTQPRYELKDVLAYAIDDAPTVRAITVEWIEQFMNRFRLDMVISDEYALLHFMLTEWEKENETN